MRFLDASMVFADVEEKLYYDACHFGARGNEILARRIAEFAIAHVERSEVDPARKGGGGPPR